MAVDKGAFGTYFSNDPNTKNSALAATHDFDTYDLGMRRMVGLNTALFTCHPLIIRRDVVHELVHVRVGYLADHHEGDSIYQEADRRSGFAGSGMYGNWGCR
jgi:hypothetical protein